MATKEQIFEWIRYTCVTDTDAEQVAEIVATKLAEENGLSHNTGSPKLLDKMERFAVGCDNAGNGRDAREVRSWIKQLRAGA